MSKAIKFSAIASAALVATAFGATAVSAWGDSSESGLRPVYTVKQITEDKVLGDKIVFNSIKDNRADMPLTDERNFVGARDASTGDHGFENVWNGNEINVEEGKTYYVRIYAHNNNPEGTDAIAKNVKVRFSLPTVAENTQRVDGYVSADNAAIKNYWDSVVFKSDRKFYLDYVEGSALLENNGIGANGGKQLADSVVTDGSLIGFNALDGNVPGCYHYANYITIKVKPVFENTSIEKTVRRLDDKKFSETVDAKVGETVEYQIHYKNLNSNTVENVVLRDSLPTNMEYVKGSTMLYNSNHKDGIKIDQDTLVTDGINIGAYKVNGSAYIRFKAVVKDVKLECGKNALVNWAKASVRNGVTTKVEGFAVQDSAIVNVNKECKTPAPKPTPKPKKELPNTGATGIVAGVLGLGGTITAAGYYIASRKQLR